MHKRLRHFINKFNILSQFGVGKNISTSNALENFSDIVYNELSGSEPVLLLYNI